MTIRIADLSSLTVDTKPIYMDWDDTEAFESFWTAVRCGGCNRVIVVRGTEGSQRHPDTHCDTPDCAGSLPYVEGPMMNCFYPIGTSEELRHTPEEAAELLIDTNLMVCRVGETYGLALTGGGMDFSWEICEAYILLGFLPPFHFCQLPAMCGRGTSKQDKRIILACRRSCRVITDWAKSRRDNLGKLTEAELRRLQRNQQRNLSA